MLQYVLREMGGNSRTSEKDVSLVFCRVLPPSSLEKYFQHGDSPAPFSRKTSLTTRLVFRCGQQRILLDYIHDS